jgi:hypothetical protein
MDKSNVTEVVRHLVDEEWPMRAVCARIHQVALAERAEIFRCKFG